MEGRGDGGKGGWLPLHSCWLCILVRSRCGAFWEMVMLVMSIDCWRCDRWRGRTTAGIWSLPPKPLITAAESLMAYSLAWAGVVASRSVDMMLSY